MEFVEDLSDLIVLRMMGNRYRAENKAIFKSPSSHEFYTTSKYNNRKESRVISEVHQVKP